MGGVCNYTIHGLYTYIKNTYVHLQYVSRLFQHFSSLHVYQVYIFVLQIGLRTIVNFEKHYWLSSINDAINNNYNTTTTNNNDKNNNHNHNNEKNVAAN